ncbi:GLABROUS1 enhancer-binding protein-like 1 [Cardamine amara subsp. amara]|uniref:GLABROUS1 enhancer-binding protein-like 1 n=1 Tax=Cardamine amara subsp. amara TaxID=228776 RepID=A0ABD1A6A2_CARAN
MKNWGTLVYLLEVEIDILIRVPTWKELSNQIIMAMTPKKHLNFSSPCVGDDSDHTPSSSPFVSQGNSPRKRTASEALAKEESKRKKKAKKKKKKMDSPLFKRIWNEEDELLVLKGLVDYRVKSRHEAKIDWDGFYRFLGGFIAAKFSKEHVLSKIRELKRRFLVHLERINKRKDPNFTTSSDSEAFGFSMMLWGPIETEVSDADVDKETFKEQQEEEVTNAEHLIDDGAAKTKENGTAQNAQQSENGEDMLKEQEVAIAEPLHDNGAANITENGDTAGGAQQSKSGEEMLEDHEEVVADPEHFNDNGAAKLHDEVVVDEITENGTAQKAQQSENGEELLKEHEEVTNAEPLNDNGVAKITENKTARKAQQSENSKEHEEVSNAEPLHNNGAAKITGNKTAQKAQKRKNGKEPGEVTNPEPLNDNGAAKITENKTTGKAQKSKNGKEILKEHGEVTNAEPLNDNGAAKIAENGTTAGKESQNEDNELYALRDAFETMMSQGLSDYQKKLQLKKLMNLGTGKRKELSDEWKAICVEEGRLNIKKLRFSAKLAEAASDSYMQPRSC